MTSSREDDAMITVGRLVEVASRTWPGINRPGGVARVTKVHEDDQTVDVSYMVGRSRERRVPIEYVTLAPHYETGQSQGLRDRSLLLGRCRRCGSLRTDCGSCDWVSEEQQQQQQQREQELLIDHPKKSASTQSTDIQDSSSDSSEDEVALRDLLRTSHKYYQRHLRNRSKWNQLMGVGSTTKAEARAENDGDDHKDTQTQKKRNQQERNIENDGLDQNHDDNSEDDDVDQLWQQSQRRYRRHLRQRTKWQRRIARKENKNSNKNYGTSTNFSNPHEPHRSVLETLGSTTIPSERGHGSKQLSKYGNLDNVESTEHNSKRLPESSSERSIDAHERPTVNIDSSQPERGQDLLMESLFDTEDVDHPNPLENNFREDHNITVDDDPDAAFIQPEGREAAENLPQDMIDQTKTIPYVQLPDFFERTAQDLEDRLIPDISLRVAELQRQERRLSSPRRLDSNDTAQSAGTLLEQCQDLWNQMTLHLIRNGTDQCRVALRRLSDDRLFRKHRNHLTQQQRKQLRSTTIMDARNLRLDALEDSVEELVRKLKTITSALEHLSFQEMEEGDDTEPVDFADDEEETPHNYETQDLIPIHLSEEAKNGTETTSDRALGEFDPHQYAYKRRTNKRSSPSLHVDKRLPDRSEFHQNVPTSRKRPKCSHTNDPLTDFIVDDVATRKLATSKSKSIRARDQTSNMHSESNASNQNEARGHHNGNDQEPRLDILFDDQDTSDDEDSEDGPSHDVMPPVMEERTPCLESDRGLRVVQPSRAAKRNTSSTRLPPQSFMDSGNSPYTQSDRVPISQRMQAFLDKNSELDMDDDSVDESNKLESRVTVRDHLAQRRNQRFQRTREQYNSHLERTTKSHQPSQRASRPDSEQRLGNTPESQDIVSMAYLLTEFNGTSGSSISVPTSSLVSNIQPRTVSIQIRENYPNHPIQVRRLLEQVQSLEGDYDHDEEFLELQDTLTDLLRTHGTSTLTELIACQSPHLGSHIQLLTTLVRSGASLEGRRQQFLELLVLQLVDAVFALLHLDGWALQIPNRVGVLQLLEPMRSALATTLPLMESVCRCIVEQLGCQEWRLSQRKDRVFVSSVDPDMWRKFVESGECSPQVGETRYRALGQVWPRLEVETVWSVLLYFGAAKSQPDQTNQARWLLITKLFSSSVLAKCSEEEDSRLPPNPQHIAAFDFDIQMFARLLDKGTLDDLPASDKLVTNLIKRAIILQAEDYLLNEESRFRAFPSFGDEKSATRFVARLWESTQESMLHDTTSATEYQLQTVQQIDFQRSQRNSTMPKMRDLLLPMSPLMASCFSLLVAWGHRVQTKKVRYTRFLKQLKGLIESLIPLEQELIARQVEGAVSDAFGDAFLEMRPPEIGNGKDRLSVFLRETGANLQILEYILTVRHPSIASLYKTSPLKLAKEVWQLVAEDALKKHRDSLAFSETFTEVESLDPMRVFAAGKVMATVVCLSLNLSPWSVSVVPPRKRLALNVDEDKGMIDYYSYSVGSVLACVDCQSSQGQSTTLLCQLLTIVTMLFHHFGVTMDDEGISPPLNRLAVEISSSYIPILSRCFRRQITLSSGTSNHVCLRLIFCALQSMNSFQLRRLKKQESMSIVINHPPTTDASHATTASQTDDFFDDLDDSVFAQLETGNSHHDTTSANSSCSQEKLFWMTLLEILAIMKPSERFKISGSLDKELSLRLSPTANYVLSKDIDKICNCLVGMAIVETRHVESRSLWDELVRLVGCSMLASEDTEYEMNLSNAIVTQVCLLAPRYKTGSSFLNEHIDLFLCKVIESLLDPNRLEIYPSCHIEVFRENGGDEAMRTALIDLDFFNGEESSRPVDIHVKSFESILRRQMKRKARADIPWTMIDNLRAVATSESHALASIFDSWDHELKSGFEESLVSSSLEKEAFVCFVFLRNIVSKCARDDVGCFEKISTHILSSMASQTLRIVQGLKYFDQTNVDQSQTTSTTNEGIRIQLLFHAFSELFVALAAWILRETPVSASDRWKALQCQLCERIFYPLLRRQCVDMTLTLKLVIQACRSVTGQLALSTQLQSGVPGCIKYFDSYYDMALRRCRQLAAAPIQVSVLHNYFIEGLCLAEDAREGPIAKVIGDSFSNKPKDSNLLARGPLQEEIDRYLPWVESQISPDTGDGDMSVKRLELLRTAIIPKIAHKNGQLDRKRKILRLVREILSFHDAFRQLPWNYNLLEVMESLVKSLRHTIIQCLKANIVDGDLMILSFACAAELAALNIHVEGSNESTLLGYCDSRVSQLPTCDFSILCESEIKALYMHVFFQWMYTLGLNLARETLNTSSAMGYLHDFRNKCINEELKNADETLLSSMILSRHHETRESKQLVDWTQVLLLVEEKVFGYKSENIRPVVNVYSKSTVISVNEETTEEGTLQPWMPTSKVTRSAKEYMTTILSLSS